MDNPVSHPKTLLARMAATYGIEPERMLSTLKATAFRGDVSNEQMMALLVVADQYSLNPWTKEIYAFPDRNHGIVPVVGVDGWSRIINSHNQFDGMEFTDGPPNERQIPEWIECRMFRKDRSHAVAVREYFVEVERSTMAPWKSHPRRMLRHKAMIQCGRLAFGFVGIFDEDEGERIRDAIDATPTPLDPRPPLIEVDWSMRDKHVEAIKLLFDELGSDEEKLSPALKDYVQTSLAQFKELYIAVFDKLVVDGVATRAYMRSLLKKSS